MEKPKHGKKRGGLLIRLAVFGLLAVVLLSLVERQIQIAEKKEELAQLQAELELQTAKNSELQSVLDNGDGMEAYAERRARRDLDFVKPNERVFIDVGGGD